MADPDFQVGALFKALDEGIQQSRNRLDILFPISIFPLVWLTDPWMPGVALQVSKKKYPEALSEKLESWLEHSLSSVPLFLYEATRCGTSYLCQDRSRQRVMTLCFSQCLTQTQN